MKFRIRGWDDGQVTFDDIENSYYAVIDRPAGINDIAGVAAPGEAGIPPYAVQGLKRWFKKLEKDQQEPAEDAKGDKSTNNKNPGNTDATELKPAEGKAPVQ